MRCSTVGGGYRVLFVAAAVAIARLRVRPFVDNVSPVSPQTHGYSCLVYVLRRTWYAALRRVDNKLCVRFYNSIKRFTFNSCRITTVYTGVNTFVKNRDDRRKGKTSINNYSFVGPYTILSSIQAHTTILTITDRQHVCERVKN